MPPNHDLPNVSVAHFAPDAKKENDESSTAQVEIFDAEDLLLGLYLVMSTSYPSCL